jgi:hypothetical protein
MYDNDDTIHVHSKAWEQGCYIALQNVSSSPTTNSNNSPYLSTFAYKNEGGVLWNEGGVFRSTGGGPAADSSSIFSHRTCYKNMHIRTYTRTLVWLDRGLRIRGGVYIVTAACVCACVFFCGWLLRS